MSDPRYRPSGRRSPTFNPARASLPVSTAYGTIYSGDIHAVPTAHYDTTAARRHGEHHHRGAPTTTITTYSVSKDPVARSSSVRDPSRTRHRSATLDAGGVKPIIVTTNHSRPHNPSSHASSGTGKSSSPNLDLYRSSDEAYLSQPASSIRSRSHQRHYSQSGTFDNDEYYRLRERVGGEDRLRAPGRPHSRQSTYAHPPRTGPAGIDFVEDYEYTKPADLARYDLDNDRGSIDRPRSRVGRRDSIDRGHYYHRPSVSVVSNDIGRSDPRRGPPPTSFGLERYNRNAAAGIYDRPSVLIPPMPPVPLAPPVDSARRSGLLDAPASPTVDRRSSRPRPVSLYQDAPPRMSLPDDMHRTRDDDRAHRDRREYERADDPYRGDAVMTRGFGLRPELLDQAAEHRRPSEADRRDRDERRPPRDLPDREPRRRSDEELDRAHGRHVEGKDRPRVEESRDRKDTGRSESKVREKIAAGLGVAAAAIGLGAKDKDKEEERDEKSSPRRRRESELGMDRPGALPTDRYIPREKDVERKPSREEPIVVEQRREPRRDRDEPEGRERDRDRERDREYEKERDRDRDRDRRRESEAKPTGTQTDQRDHSPHSDDSAGRSSRRRRRPSIAFNPTDTKGLMDLKAQLAALEDKEKPKEKERVLERPVERPVERPRYAETDMPSSSAAFERQSPPGRDRDRDRDRAQEELRTRDDSRGRELALVDPDHKQVRVVSPPRDKSDQKPIKGILKQPKVSFPEEPNPIREGVAPHKDDKTKKDVPEGARWTKINRRLVNPEALTVGKERFEVRDDFVIVLRVLSKEEIQEYATATSQLREKRRQEPERDSVERDDEDRDRGRNRDEEERRRRHRHRRGEREDEEDDRRDRDGDRDRHRRHRHDDPEDDTRPRASEYEDYGAGHSSHHRSQRERDRDTVASSSIDDRR